MASSDGLRPIVASLFHSKTHQICQRAAAHRHEICLVPSSLLLQCA